MFEDFKDDVVKNFLSDIINKGKEQGLINKDIETNVIILTHWQRITNIIERSMLPNRNIFDPVFMQLIKVSIIGITTVKGHELADDILSK